MKYSDLSALLLKISGLLIIIITLINFPNYFFNYYSLQNFYGNEVGDFITFLVAVLFPLLVTLSVAIIMFVFPKTISNSLVIKEKGKEDIELKDISVIAYSAIGLYFVAFSIADLMYWASYFYLMMNAESASEYLTLENYSRVIASIGELIIGAVLLLGANGINNLILKLRTKGFK